MPAQRKPKTTKANTKKGAKTAESETPSNNTVVIYTDGSCLSNPGPGGWAAVIKADGEEKRLSGGATDTTNNRMELMAVISALTALCGPSTVTLCSDSQYVINAFNKGWLAGWKKNGWNNSAGDLKNVDLWKLLDKITRIHDITWVWVKGHDGNQYNEICDQMAVAAAKHYQSNGDTPYHLPPTDGDEDDNSEPVETTDELPATEEPIQETLPDEAALTEAMTIPEAPEYPDDNQTPQLPDPTSDWIFDRAPGEDSEAFSVEDMEIPEILPEEDPLVAPEPTVEGEESLCENDDADDPAIAELLTQQMAGVERVMHVLERFIVLHNEEVAGVPYPCGAFDWCEHCVEQSPQEGVCKCADAFMKFSENKE